MRRFERPELAELACVAVWAHSPIDMAKQIATPNVPTLIELLSDSCHRDFSTLLAEGNAVPLQLLSRSLVTQECQFSPARTTGKTPGRSSHTDQSCTESSDSLHPTNALPPSGSILSSPEPLRLHFFPSGIGVSEPSISAICGFASTSVSSTSSAAVPASCAWDRSRSIASLLPVRFRAVLSRPRSDSA